MSKLRQPFRAILGLTNIMVRLGLNRSPTDVINKPEAERQLERPPFWMTRLGDQSVTTREQSVPARGGPVKVRTYLPAGLSPGRPAIVYLHGGGFILGGLDGCDYISRGLAARTSFPVFSVEYRLAPDSPFPAALHDCEDALRWVVETKPEGIDPTCVAVAGDSAGGNLTAALTLLLRDNGGPVVRHQTLIYPLTDGTCSLPSWREHSGGGMDSDAGVKMMAAYAGEAGQEDPLVSPLLAPDLSGLPPALVVTAECDVLLDDGHQYAGRLMEAGVSVDYRTYAGLPHGFVTMPRLTRDSDRALDAVADAITATLRPEHSPRD